MRTSALLVLVACGRSPDGPKVTVIAESGDAPEPNASILSHLADGEVIDAETPDATGRADVTAPPGALVTVVFPSLPVQVVTTLAPTGTLVIHGPPVPSAPTAVGALAIMPAMPIMAAGGFDVELGCVTVHVPTMPTTIDVIGPCLGSDTSLDVLIHALDTDGHELAYAAGRVALDGDVAELDPAGWSTTGTAVPVTADGVAPAVTWALLSDGLPFDRQTVTTGGELPAGLVVDGAIVTAQLGTPGVTQTTTYAIADAPSAIAIAAADFLPPLQPMLTRTGSSFAWTAGPAADAVDLRVAWDGVVWDAVLPPDATSVTYPALQFTPPAPAGAQLRYLDASDVTSLAAASDLYAEQAAGSDLIFRVPAGGKLAVTLSSATL